MLRAKVSDGGTLANLSAKCDGGALPSALMVFSKGHMRGSRGAYHSSFHPLKPCFIKSHQELPPDRGLSLEASAREPARKINHYPYISMWFTEDDFPSLRTAWEDINKPSSRLSG